MLLWKFKSWLTAYFSLYTLRRQVDSKDLLRVTFLLIIPLKIAAMKIIILTDHLYIYSGTCLIRHTKGPGKYIGLYRMSEYSGFISVNRDTLGLLIFVRCHRMSENSGVGLHKSHYTNNMYSQLNGGQLHMHEEIISHAF